MSGEPLVSVIVPARNEAEAIADCLEAVLAQDWPPDHLEVIVVAAGSTDDTAVRSRTVLDGRGLSRWTVLVDGDGSTSNNLNRALAVAQGEVICRVDARSVIEAHHVRHCAEILTDRQDVAVVGGAQVATPVPGAGIIPRGIARALRNPVATGFARYRRRSVSGPTDTVYLGAFRAADLHHVGGWDERFATNQDFELNRRLAARGVVWFDARLATGYRPRTTVRALASQHRRFGRWKAAAWIEGGVPISPRQVVLLVGPLLAGTVWASVARRRPFAAVLGGVGGVFALDAAGREKGDITDRATGAGAAAVMAAAWWTGIVEQFARRVVRGETLLS